MMYKTEQEEFWAGDLIDNYGLKLIDYGFIYKRDNWVSQVHDSNWFLLEK